MNFQNRFIVLLVLAIFLPIVIFVGIGYYIGHRTMEDFTYQQINAANDYTVKALDDYFRTRQEEVSGFLQDAYDQESCRRFFTSAENRNSAEFQSVYQEKKIQLREMMLVHDYRNITVVNNQNIILLDVTGGDARIGQTADGNLGTAVQRGQGAVTFSQPFAPTDDESGVSIYLSGPLKNDIDQIVGVMVVELDLDDLYIRLDLVDEYGLTKTGETYLGVDDSYSILIVSPQRFAIGQQLTRRVNYDGSVDRGMQLAVQGEDGWGLDTDYREQKVLADWQHLEVVGWGVVTKMDEAEAFGSFDSIRLYLVFALSGSLAVIFLLVWLLIKINVYGPLKKLEMVAEAIDHDEFEKAEVDRKLLYSEDHYGKIATHLHHIAESHKHHQHSIDKRDN